MTRAFNGRYAGRRVLVTGHTGFKGAWLSLWLKQLGAEVHGFANGVPTDPSLYEVIAPGTFAAECTADIRDDAALSRTIASSVPDLVFHLAAQSLVRRSYAEPIETLSVNVMGTAMLMDAVRKSGRPSAIVIATSDKCYENRGWDRGYREDDAMGGHDVYSASKGAAELVAAAWRRSFFQSGGTLGPVATVRAGNVIGGGDYAADRIVPDCVRALVAGRPVGVRRAHATRPWQHVLDCLSGYLCLGERLLDQPAGSPFADAFNVGPDARSTRTVQAVVETFLQTWPGRLADQSEPDAPHEAAKLQLSIEKAADRLAWRPVWGFEEAVRESALWYRARHVDKAGDMRAFSVTQISTFTSRAAQSGVAWAQPR